RPGTGSKGNRKNPFHRELGSASSRIATNRRSPTWPPWYDTGSGKLLDRFLQQMERGAPRLAPETSQPKRQDIRARPKDRRGLFGVGKGRKHKPQLVNDRHRHWHVAPDKYVADIR